jgi:hypothetical protein
MGNKAVRTEHAGAKRGRGAYYSRKKWAKRDSAIRRRQNDRRTIDEQRRENVAPRH